MSLRISDRDFIRQITDAVDDEVIRYHQAMEKGLPQDQYNTHVGIIRGLRWVVEKANDIRKVNDREDG